MFEANGWPRMDGDPQRAAGPAPLTLARRMLIDPSFPKRPRMRNPGSFSPLSLGLAREDRLANSKGSRRSEVVALEMRAVCFLLARWSRLSDLSPPLFRAICCCAALRCTAFGLDRVCSLLW